MEKRVWVKPEMDEATFAANDYVAACGDSGVTYKFECDAPQGTLYYYKNLTADMSLPTDWYNRTDRERLGSYTPCSEWHEAESDSEFYYGFVDYNSNGSHDSSNSLIETVIVWVERYRYGGGVKDAHATKELDMNSWETAKS